jgi:hypothetical protein
MNLPILILALLALLRGLGGCTATQFPTLILHDSPSGFVRLEAIPDGTSAPSYSHPVTISAEQMAAVLGGIIIEEPVTRLPIYDDLSRPRRHPAFTDTQIDFFAPLLTRGLTLATPEELVTFYQTRSLSMGRREVTSGGLYVDGEELHFFLSNYRSKTHTIADPGMVDTTDDRLTPMEQLSPQVGKLLFEPAESYRSPVPEGLGRFSYFDRRELIINLRTLPPRPLGQSLKPTGAAPPSQ